MTLRTITHRTAPCTAADPWLAIEDGLSTGPEDHPDVGPIWMPGSLPGETLECPHCGLTWTQREEMTDGTD